MSSLVFALLAAGCSSLSSLFFRKNTDNSADRSAGGYLVSFYFSSFILAFLLYPAIWKTSINFTVLFIGMCVGLLSSVLLRLTFRALKKGPTGLTYAFQNASAIFPGLILFLLLGSNFGFTYSFIQIVGIGLVLMGLFLGTKTPTISSPKASSKWLKYALACFVVQTLALTLIQARCVLFDCSEMGGFISKFSIPPTDDVWFMPGLFGTATLVQGLIFLREKKRIEKSEAFYGCLGGIANFSSTCLLLLATKYALPFEKGILFPCFAVASMILCNLWANRLYKENFNFKTNLLCSVGIFMAAAQL